MAAGVVAKLEATVASFDVAFSVSVVDVSAFVAVVVEIEGNSSVVLA